MGTGAPTPVVIPVHCAPKKAPCPTCGKHGRRKRTFTRTVRTVAYKTVAFLEITCGEYGARCDCCTTFRNSPEGVLPRALYDNKVRDLVLDRILKDGMSIERTLESLSREFLLDLSTGFVYDVLYDHAKQLDMAAHRRTVLALFSGTLCVDELHVALGHRPAVRPACGLCPGRRQRPGPHAAVPGEPQELGTGPRGRGDRRLEPVPHGAGRIVARRGPSAVRLSRHQGHQQADPRRRAADADGDEPARQGRAQEEAGPQGGQVQGRRPPGHDGQGEGALRVQAPSPDREAAGGPHRGGARRLDPDAGVPARVGDLAAVRRPDLLAVRCAQGSPPGGLPPGRDRARPGVPGRARAGQGDGANRRGEVPQADGVLEQPGEPTGADQQPRGADQPDVPVPGEGAVQVASTADVGEIRGVDAGRHLEGTNHRPGEGDGSLKADRASQDGEREEKTTPGRVSVRWCSARSLAISRFNRAWFQATKDRVRILTPLRKSPGTWAI